MTDFSLVHEQQHQNRIGSRHEGPRRPEHHGGGFKGDSIFDSRKPNFGPAIHGKQHDYGYGSESGYKRYTHKDYSYINPKEDKKPLNWGGAAKGAAGGALAGAAIFPPFGSIVGGLLGGLGGLFG